MLRTADDVLEALRARKAALGLSNEVVDELAGLTRGHFHKVAGPSRMKRPSLYTFVSIAGALGLAVQLVPDPDGRVTGRWERRREQSARNTDISQAVLKKARTIVLAEQARKGGTSFWAGKSPKERRANIAKLNAARAAKRQTGLNQAHSVATL